MAGYSNQLLNLERAFRQQALIHKRIVEGIPERLRQQTLMHKRITEGIPEQLRQQALIHERIAERLWQLNEFPKRFAEHQRRTIESFCRFANEQPERDRKALQRLGEGGWFFDPEMPIILLQILVLLFDQHPNKMAEWLRDFFRKRLDVIEGKLIDSYPHRGHIFRQAFEAHREGKYGLSVPVFLTQADGIFWERTPENQSLFISMQRKTASSKYSSQISHRYIEIWLHPLFILLPLWMNKSERDDRSESFVGLNRHQVLHGVSVDYDTEQNSLKAISLLSYLQWILSRTDEPKGDDS